MAGWKKARPQGERHNPIGVGTAGSGVCRTPAPRRQKRRSRVLETRCTSATAGAPVTGQAGGRAASAPVAAIDVDVAMRQVAGPHGRLALPEADIDGDLDLP